jgi:hypothetical protein
MAQASAQNALTEPDVVFVRRAIWLLDVNRHLFRGSYCDHVRKLTWRMTRPHQSLADIPEQAVDELVVFLEEEHHEVSGHLLGRWKQIANLLRTGLHMMHVYRLGVSPQEWIRRKVFLEHVHDSGKYAALHCSEQLIRRLGKFTPSQGQSEHSILEDVHALALLDATAFDPRNPADLIIRWGLETLHREGWPKPLLDFRTPYSLAYALVDSVRDPVRKRVVDEVPRLLRIGASVADTREVSRERDWHETILHAAITSHRDDEICEVLVVMLIDNGADVNARALLDRAPLHDACSGGKLATVEALLRRGADPNARNEYGQTPLINAIDRRHTEVTEIVRTLLASGADCNASAQNAESPLHRAARHGLHDVIELLLGAGANPNAAGLWGFTPLYEAISAVALIEDLALPSIRLLLCVANSKDPKDGHGQHASAFLRRVIELSAGSHPAAEAAIQLLNEQS